MKIQRPVLCRHGHRHDHQRPCHQPYQTRTIFVRHESPLRLNLFYGCACATQERKADLVELLRNGGLEANRCAHPQHRIFPRLCIRRYTRDFLKNSDYASRLRALLPRGCGKTLCALCSIVEHSSDIPASYGWGLDSFLKPRVVLWTGRFRIFSKRRSGFTQGRRRNQSQLYI